MTPQPVATTPLLLRQSQVAETLGISERSVRRLTKEEILPTVRVAGAPRYRRADVEAFVASLQPEATT